MLHKIHPALRGALWRKRHEPKKPHKESSPYPNVPLREPRLIVPLPSFSDISKTDVRYPLIEPLASAHVVWDPEQRQLVYRIEEPPITPEERDLLQRIETNLTELIDVKITGLKGTDAAVDYIRRKVAEVLTELGIGLPPNQYITIMYYILRDFVGLNEIEPLMYDPYIEDIGCTGTGTPLYIVHRKYGSIETSLTYKDLDYLSNFVIKLSERCGRYISYANPLLDGSLPDGSRVQASLAKDVTTKGPTFSIRKFRRNPFSPIDMINNGTASPGMLAYLWVLMQYGVSLLISGGVSVGKTSFLNVATVFIPPEFKIISIEDTREINLPHENWIPSVARTGFGIPEASGKRYGEIDLFDLLRESFRQNPDYVIVGEVRGKEANVMFQGISSGHPSIGTIHAGSIDDVVKRLETPPIDLPPALIDSLDVIIIMVNAHEKGKSSRRIKEVSEIQSVDPATGRAHTIRTFSWLPAEDEYKENILSSEVLHRLAFEKGIPYQSLLEELENRRKVLEWMQRYDITQFEDVASLINLYYKDPATVLGWVRANTPPSKTQAEKALKKHWQPVTGLKVAGTAD